MKRGTTWRNEANVARPIVQSTCNGLIDDATLDLLKSWQREDATTNPKDIKAAEKELAEFKKAMNDNRTASGEPLLHP